MIYLVQFTGAQSTGKSTLAKNLYEDLKNQGYSVSFIGETSRKLKEAEILSDIDTDASDISQLLINGELALQFFEKCTLSKGSHIIIAERTAICCKAYANLLSGSGKAFDFMQKQTDRFLEASYNLMHNYSLPIRSLLFYCPLNIPFVSDSVRKEKSRDAVDFEIQNILKSNIFLYEEIPAYSYENRYNFVKTSVEELIKEI